MAGWIDRAAAEKRVGLQLPWSTAGRPRWHLPPWACMGTRFPDMPVSIRPWVWHFRLQGQQSMRAPCLRCIIATKAAASSVTRQPAQRGPQRPEQPLRFRITALELTSHTSNTQRALFVFGLDRFPPSKHRSSASAPFLQPRVPLFEQRATQGARCWGLHLGRSPRRGRCTAPLRLPRQPAALAP